MERRRRFALTTVIVALVMVMSLLPGCGADNTAKEDADTITVYL